MKRVANRASVSILTGIALLLLLPGPAGSGSPAHPTCARAAGSNHVAIVVQHSGGGGLAACAAFTGADVGAEEALALAGIQSGTSDAYGGPGYRALCQVDREPATYPQNCLNANTYWSLWVHSGKGWALAGVGVSGLRLRDGDWLGLHYVQFHQESAPPLPRTGLCTPAPSTPIPTANPSTPPVPEPAAGSVPTATPPEPTPSAVDTSAPPNLPSPASSPAPISPSSPSDRRGGGADAGLLLAAAGGGGLLGLLLIQLIARRRG